MTKGGGGLRTVVQDIWQEWFHYISLLSYFLAIIIRNFLSSKKPQKIRHIYFLISYIWKTTF